MIRYLPDTCKCVIILESDGITFSEVEQRCSVHKNKDGADLIKDIIKRNALYGVSSEKPTKKEIAEATKVKAKEKAKTKINKK